MIVTSGPNAVLPKVWSPWNVVLARYRIGRPVRGDLLDVSPDAGRHPGVDDQGASTAHDQPVVVLQRLVGQ